jgi:uncharacterized protein (TIGR02588 family)
MPLVEWITAGVALVVIAGLMGVTIYDGLARRGTQPVIEVTVERVQHISGGAHVIVAVRNTTAEAAADVVIEGMLSVDGTPLRSQVQLDYVPGAARREATLVFPAVPAPGALTVRVLGFTVP